MLIGFKKRFKEPIENGTKIFTVRTRRKITPKIGETIHMYTGLRTKNCEKISSQEKLVSTQDVRILIKDWGGKWGMDIHVDGRRLSAKEIIDFTISDGFLGVHDFKKYWMGDKPKEKNGVKRAGGSMVIYHWTNFRF
ncbi:ASCH domain-containing protein [Litoribacter populi]|uniref:ASCH domain-containing protein n=1 Tax=Litoribacter populi TaxID=2598460 RepID=UPI00117E42BF|nr:ASCH domain-containing protein [Litoribacter populi]